jgi:putative peptidoglycan lipid II flippase
MAFRYGVLVPLPRVFSQHHIIGGTIVLALLGFGASLMGLVRDLVFNRVFPDNAIVDVYIASFRPSDFLFQTCVAAALGTVLVPVLASHAAHDRKEEIEKVLSGTMLLGGLAFGLVAILLAILFPIIAPLLVQFTGERMELYIHFGRLALLSNFLFVFGNTLGQQLITSQRYWVYGITPIIYTLGTILGTLFLTPIIGPYGPIAGTLVGTSIYVILRLSAVLWSGIRLRWTLWHPEFTSMGFLILPRILSLGALQAQLLFFDRFASGLPPGSLSVNAYARNFQSVLVGVTGIALAQSAYSLLGKSAAWKNEELFRKYLRWGISTLLIVTIPGSLILVLLSPIVANVMGIQAIKLFSLTLLAYSFSIPFESMNHLLLRAFYATKQTLLPALMSLLNTVVAVGIAWFFIETRGVQSLGVGYAAGQFVLMVGLSAALPMALKRVRKE